MSMDRRTALKAGALAIASVAVGAGATRDLVATQAVIPHAPGVYPLRLLLEGNARCIDQAYRLSHQLGRDHGVAWCMELTRASDPGQMAATLTLFGWHQWEVCWAEDILRSGPASITQEALLAMNAVAVQWGADFDE